MFRENINGSKDNLRACKRKLKDVHVRKKSLNDDGKTELNLMKGQRLLWGKNRCRTKTMCQIHHKNDLININSSSFTPKSSS